MVHYCRDKVNSKQLNNCRKNIFLCKRLHINCFTVFVISMYGVVHDVNFSKTYKHTIARPFVNDSCFLYYLYI